MAIVYKFDVLQALKEKGFSAYRLRKEKLLGESTIQCLRSGQLVSFTVIEWLCSTLGCNIGDLLDYVPGQEEQE